MTDRPRVYRASRVRHGGGLTSFAEPVTLIEWDREKVVPVIMAAIQTYLQAGEGDTYDPRGEADAIFDALDTSGGERD